MCSAVSDLCSIMDCNQAPLSMGFFRQEHWGGLPIPPPGDHANPEIEPSSVMFPALAGRFFTTSATCGAHTVLYVYINGIDMTYVFTCYLYPLYIECLTVCQILFQVLRFHQLMTPTKVPAFMGVISQQGETDTDKHNK